MRKEYLIPLVLILIVLPLLLLFRSQIFTTNPQMKKQSSLPSQPMSQRQTPLLEETVWEWVETKNADGTVTTPTDPSTFRMILKEGQMTSTTDCNTMSGSYIVDQEVLSFGALTATKMFCQNSQESLYTAAFPLVTSYTIHNTNLELVLIKDLGIMKFVSVE